MQSNESRTERKNPRFPKLDRPWLVAAWPGMGSIASLAAGNLVSALSAEPAGMIPERELFPINHVEVKNGIARTGRLPRSMFFSRHDPDGVRDVLLFLAEAQPERGGFALCQRILDLAVEHGVERVVTFASLGTALHPTAVPRVFGAVTAPELLDDLARTGVERLIDGQVAGLNGALLAAAAERNVPAVCLLGEFPYFGAAVPNPKSALSILRAFSRLSGLELDLADLEKKAEQIEPQLLQLLEQLREQAGAEGVLDEPESELEIDLGSPPRNVVNDAANEDADADASPALDAPTRERIERLFAAARVDGAARTELKGELDRLGLFAIYEDRFLDLYGG